MGQLTSGDINGFECYSTVMGREVVWYRVRRWADTGFQLKQVSYSMGPLQECGGIYGSMDDHSRIYGMHEGALSSQRWLQKRGRELVSEAAKKGRTSDAYKNVAEAHDACFRPLEKAAEPRFDELEVVDGRYITDEAIAFAKKREQREREDRWAKADARPLGQSG